MKKLKRLVEEASLAIRVLFLWVLVAALPSISFALALHLGQTIMVSGALATASLPAVLACWGIVKLVSWIVGRVAGFLWKLRAFRLLTWTAGLAAAAWLAYVNVVVSGDLAWLALASEGIALAAVAVAVRIAGKPSRTEEFLLRQRMRIAPKWNRPIRWMRALGWIAGIALVDLWLYAAVEEWLGGNWISIPWSFLEHVRIPLAAIAPAVFTVAALLAGQPYLRRAAPRWIFRISRPSTARQEQSHRIFGRKPFYYLERVRKMVPVIMPDGRPGEAGERFVFMRLWWTGVAFATTLSVAVLSGMAEDFIAGKPQDLSGVSAYQPVVSTVALDRNGRRMCTFTLENRIYVPLSEIPPHVRDAFIAAEDQRFWQHDGIDPIGILRAAKSNFSEGTSQGASTLDQQVIKQIILKDSSKRYERKISEILLAVRLEKQMTAKYGVVGAKEHVLEVYLNHVYLGKGFYGVEAASQGYFGKSAKDLSLAEAAILAGLPKAPARDSPDGHFDRAKDRQRYVLGRMLELGSITRAEHDEAVSEDIVNIRPSHQLNATAAPYACEEVRRYAEKTYGYDAVYKRGLLIRTTFDLDLQEKAQAAVRYGLLDLERRLGFAGPEGHDADAGDRCDPPAEWVADNAIEPNARVIARAGSSMTLCVRGNRFELDPDDVNRVGSWERAKPGRAVRVGDLMTVRVETRKGPDGKDARYALTARRTGGADADGKPHYEALQAALVAIEPGTGEIRAIVGGYDWSEIQFDIATQARRQTGSSIKPYIYLTALMKGETVVSRVDDKPVCIPTASGLWCPTNYDNHKPGFRAYYGNVDLMTALAKSLNSVSVRLLVEVGLDQALATIRALGVQSKIERVFPIAVGSPELTLLEHTAGYASILSNGQALPVQHASGAPGLFVTKVSERVRRADGVVEEHVLYEAKPQPPRQAVPSGDAYAMTHLMKGVVESGTGTRAKRLRRPVAGKTGTTNSFRDVWFMGGTADMVVGVWVGRMTPDPIAKEATGGSVALPIWEGFMEAAYPVTDAAPARDFPIPDDVTLVDRGERRDGAPVLLPFQRGKMPQSYLTAPSADF
ncbi:MAG TPA: transglycosylase domain-containing protein, partial [Patescibacteria group bacterium]|nr:transglycosylase domain-containing protein [Patescibacteria group bacterium]